MTYSDLRVSDDLGAVGRAFKSPRPDQSLYFQHPFTQGCGTAHLRQVQIGMVRNRVSSLESSKPSPI